MPARVGLGQHAGAHLLADPRVILRSPGCSSPSRQRYTRLSPTCATTGASFAEQHGRRRRRHAAQRFVRFHRRGEAAVGEPERGLQPVAVEAERADRTGNGQVRVDVGVARVVDERLDDLDGQPRRDLAGRVAAHAVGDHVQAEVRPRAVRVFVVLPAQTRMGGDGRGDAAA